MALVINSGYKSLNLYFTEPGNTYYIDDVNSSGTQQIASTLPRSDIDKLYIWIGNASNFTADNTTLIYQGTFQNNISIDKYLGNDLQDNQTYYIRYAITSKLEPDLKIISTAQSGTTRDIQAETSGIKPWFVVTETWLAEAGDRIIADSSGGSFTITLPANPEIGDSVTVTDGYDFSQFPVTLARNGSLIVDETQQGAAKDIKLDILHTTFEFIYTGALRGWDFTATTGPKGEEGLNAPLLKLESQSIAFTYDNYNSVDTETPGSIIFTAVKQNIEGTVTFTAKAYNIDNTELGDVTLTGTGNTRTLTSTNFNSIAGVTDRLNVRYVKVTASVSYQDNTLTDTVSIFRIDNGSDAIVHQMVNESHIVPADNLGTVTTYAGAFTKGYIFRGAVNETMNWTITKTDGSGITTTLDAPSARKISSTGTIGSISGTGPWTAVITDLPSGSTDSLIVNTDTISAIEDSYGRLYTGTPTSVLVIAKTATSITYRVTGGSAPIAGPIGGLAKGLNEYTLTATDLNISTNSSSTTVTATKDGKVYEKVFSLGKSKDGDDGKVITVDVENDVHAIPFNAVNQAVTYQFSGTKIQVFENTDELQYTQTLLTTDVGKWTITGVTSQGITSSINSTASNKPAVVSNQAYVVVPNHSNLSLDTASITYTIQVRTKAGELVSNLLGNQTFAKVQRSGVYRLIGASSITVSSTGTVNQITLSGQLFDGTTVTQNAGFLTQQVLPGGTESTPRVSSLTTNALNTSTSVLVKLYDAVTGGNLVDQAELKVSKDGLSGQSVDLVFTRIATGSTPTITNTANPPSGNSTWTTSPPVGTNPLWASTGYANAPYSTWTWDTPVRVSGEGIVEVSAYLRSNAASVSTPARGSYDFTTRTLTPPKYSTGGVYAVSSIVAGGTGYAVNNTIKILGSLLGGSNGIDDLNLLVTSVSSGVITGVSIVTPYSACTNGTYNNVASSAVTGSGTGARFNITVTNATVTQWSNTVTNGTDPVWETRAYVTDTAPSTMTWSTPVRTSMSARSIDISGIVSVKYATNISQANRFSPQSLSLSAVTSNLIGTVSYAWTTSSTGITLTNSTTQNVSIAFSGTNTDTKTITLTVTDSIGSLTKTIDIPVVQDAPNTVDITYTNDSHLVPITGGINWTGSGGNIQVYEGTSALSLNSTTLSATYPTALGKYNLTITKVSGDTLTPGAISGTTTVTLAQWGGTLTQATVYRITAYVLTNSGVQVTLSTDATIVPSRDNIIYSLSVSPSSIARTSPAKTLIPASLTATLYQTIGNATPVLYAGRFIIDGTVDGTNWTAFSVVTSTSNESSRSFTVPTTPNNIKGVRVRAYLAGGTTTQIDEEIITIINDGDKGADGTSVKSVDINSTGGTIKKAGTVYTPATISLSATPQNLTSPTYSWAVSGGTPATATTQSITITPNSTSSVVATVTATEGSNSYQKTVTFAIVTDGIGTDGKRTATGYVFYKSATADSVTTLSAPTATSYQFTTGTFSGGSFATNGTWSIQAPTYNPSNGTKYWATTYTAVEDTAGGNSSSGVNLQFGTPQTTIGFSGLVTFTSLSTAGQTVIDGANIKTGSIVADKIDTTGLTIKNNAGQVIFSSGVPLDWANISNTYPSALNNSSISISSNGSLTGGGGGQVTIGGLGYTGALDANKTSVDTNGQIQGVSSGAGTTVANTKITIDSTSGQIAGIGTGVNTVIANSKVVLSKDASNNLVLSNGTGTNSSIATGALAWISKILKNQSTTYIDSGAITNALIGNIIASANFDGTVDETTGNVDGSNSTTGWAIGKAGNAVFNNVTIRGNLTGGTTTNYKVQVGANIGPTPGHHGLTLSETNYSNIFLRRQADNHIFFRLTGTGANPPAIDFSTESNVLSINGNITCKTLTADNLITTGMIQANQVTNVTTAQRPGYRILSFFNDNTTFGYLWPENTRCLAFDSSLVITPTNQSKILINWSTQYFSPYYQGNLIELWRLVYQSGTWTNTRLFYIGSHSDVNNTSPQTSAYRIQGEEVASNSIVDTGITAGIPNYYALIIGNLQGATVYAGNSFMSLTELKR